jgi:hypothetical protein
MTQSDPTTATTPTTRSEVPAFLAHLPRHGRLPIPFFTSIGLDGKPNFRAHDQAKHNRAIAHRLCGVCGKGLGYWLTFAAGPTEVATRAFTYMPAMHRECALASLVMCPFLAYETRDRTRDVPMALRVLPEEPPPKPGRFALVTAREYKTHEGAPGWLYVRWQPPKKIEWWAYKDGQLLPEEAP